MEETDAPRKRRDRISAVHDDDDRAETTKKKDKKRSKKSRRKAQLKASEAAEEQRLTNLLFGCGEGGGDDDVAPVPDEYDLVQDDLEYEDEEVEMAGAGSSSVLFEIDRTGASTTRDDDDQDDDNEEQPAASDDDEKGKGKEETTASTAAWVDEDDANLQVNLLDSDRLRKLRKSRTEEAASALSGVELEERLRHRYQSSTMMMSSSTSSAAAAASQGGAGGAVRTDWANLDSKGQLKKDDDSTSDDDETAGNTMFNSSAPLLRQPKASMLTGGGEMVEPNQRLAPHTIQMVRCPDANQADPNSAVVQAVHFHVGSDPEKPLMLTAGLDKTLRFFQVGVEKSEKIHGVHFPKMPIYSASFLGNSSKVVASGRRPFFYLYDTVAGKLDQVPKMLGRSRQEKSLERCVASPDGRTIAFWANDGYIILFDAHNKRWITDLKVNGSVRAICFTPQSEQHHIMASGSDGDVYRWDLRNSRRPCIERFSNQDGTITSSLAASSRHVAVGAESGVVNLYSNQALNSNSRGFGSQQQQQRTPIKSILNLSTSADRVRFNHDGQILAMSTQRDRQNNNSLKLLHVPTATVFSNWPTSKTPLGYVWSMDFSPQSKFLAIGNDKGKCLLYRLNHYHHLDT